jgi:Skp family chaperone for outer membrane proteins
MMKKTAMGAGVFVVALALAGSFPTSQAQTSAPATALKLGVVNIVKVLTECQANADYREKNLEKRRQIKTEVERLKTEADAIQKELESNVLQSGSEEYKKRMEEWFSKVAQAKVHEETQTQAMAALTQAWMEQLYQMMVQEITRIAHQDGLDLVLEYDDSPLEAKNPGELERAIMTRKVLYGSAHLDLTGRVLEAMNKMYEAEKVGGPAAGAGN